MYYKSWWISHSLLLIYQEKDFDRRCYARGLNEILESIGNTSDNNFRYTKYVLKNIQQRQLTQKFQPSQRLSIPMSEQNKLFRPNFCIDYQLRLEFLGKLGHLLYSIIIGICLSQFL